MLDQLGRDLTALARNNAFTHLIPRQRFIDQLARTILRKEKPNAILIGPPGVGKTALVECMAHQIAQPDADSRIRELRIVELLSAALVAGTTYRGQMEERLLALIDELKQRPDVVVFIDEFHLITGGYGTGAMDIANILKPALARGDIRCIGATTHREYERVVEADPALARRLIPVRVDAPSAEETLHLLTQVAPSYEQHHQVRIDEDALAAAVALSVRYLANRQLPDKAFDLLDSACVSVAVPTIALGESERRRHPIVTVEAVAATIADMTGIPMHHVREDRAAAGLGDIQLRLSSLIVGQSAAVEAVAETISVAQLALRDLDRPRGVFLFGGPSGVGKTALAKAMAQTLFGNDSQFLRIDLSEYQEHVAISRLIGAPPGYIGHDRGGQLTSHLQTHPYSVILLDEIEKAHPQVLDLFLQVFDAGRITDAYGQQADARHAYFVLTTNLPIDDASQALRTHLRPEFLNRIDRIVRFDPLSEDSLISIAQREIGALSDRVAQQGGAIRVDDEVLRYLCRPATDGGAANGRTIIRRVEQEIASVLAGELNRMDLSRRDDQWNFTIHKVDDTLQFTTQHPQT